MFFISRSSSLGYNNTESSRRSATYTLREKVKNKQFVEKYCKLLNNFISIRTKFVKKHLSLSFPAAQIDLTNNIQFDYA